MVVWVRRRVMEKRMRWFKSERGVVLQFSQLQCASPFRECRTCCTLQILRYNVQEYL